MSSLDKAVETQINNIQTKTGKSLDELAALIKQSGLTKHSEIREMLMRDLGLGHGDANTLVHVALQSDGQRAAEAQGRYAPAGYRGSFPTIMLVGCLTRRSTSGFTPSRSPPWPGS